LFQKPRDIFLLEADVEIRHVIIQDLPLNGTQAFQALLTGLANECRAAPRDNARDCIDLV
jgi:hypothetical protein